MPHDTAGNPMTGIKWTRRTTEKIADELGACGIEVCASTVAKLLKGLEFRVRVNHKKLSSGSGPDRDAQFTYLAAQRETFARQGWPIVSVDSKKRELVGNFKNSGATWTQSPPWSTTTTSAPTPKASPCPTAATTSQPTAATCSSAPPTTHRSGAVDNLAKWWVYHGRGRYPDTTELLVLADGGGSNGARNRAWKQALAPPVRVTASP